nr:hypothetical protein [Tanacetum cinerariifolium]
MSDSPEKRCAHEVAILPYDIIFKILLLLPTNELLKLMVVCKPWYQLIRSPNFVEAHMSRCEAVLTFLEYFTESHSNTFSIVTNSNQPTLFEPSSRKLQMCLLDFEDKNIKISGLNISGFRDILATCDGLVLVKSEANALLVLNPTTRKLLPLKPGTIVRHSRDESYGFVFSHHTKEYKIVHLFRDKSSNIDSEILNVKHMSWKGCSVPSSGLFRDFDHKPVAASGVLYWLPRSDGASYIVSMDINEEKFVRKDLPVDSNCLNDRLVENGGLLNFVAHMTVYRIQLWTLKRDAGEDKWVKRFRINMDYDITDLVPVLMTKESRRLIFKMSDDEELYEYDMEDEEMEQVLVDRNIHFSAKIMFPHMNTLASWDNSGPLW